MEEGGERKTKKEGRGGDEKKREVLERLEGEERPYKERSTDFRDAEGAGGSEFSH